MRFITNLQFRARTWAVPTAIIVAALVLMASFGAQTFKLPLIGDHCMKTTKSIEVAYNLPRYGDFLHEYVDWKAVPQNPTGRQGSILRYESPLSAAALGLVYAAVGGEPFEKRIAVARVFTWIHLALGFLLVTIYLLRRNLTALIVFSFLFTMSAFTVSYSTKPLAETYALLYQPLLLAVGVYLLDHPLGAIKKSAVLAAATSLLCLGGKMNYFLLAFPLIVAFPFLDSRIRGIRDYLRYFALFVGTAAVGAVVLIFFSDFSFYKAFVYMVRGNKPLVGGSLWATFVEGFDYVDAILKRTRGDFGGLVFDWGRIALVYVAAKFVYALGAMRKRELTRWERFSVVLFLFIAGHAVNYVVLRNLFIPHRYYVVPIFMIICLALAVMIADFRALLLGHFPGNVALRRFVSERLPAVFAAGEAVRRYIGVHRAPIALSGMAFAAAGCAAYFSTMLTNPNFRTTAILAIKTAGSSSLAMDIGQGTDRAAVILTTVAWICFACGVAVLLLWLPARSVAPVDRFWSGLSYRAARFKVYPATAIFAVFLLVPGTSILYQNGRIFYDYAAEHGELHEKAEQLANIRRDTVPGDLVLCWKPCYAFYADKRSILEPKHEDVPYYRSENIHSVMGPVKPFHRFYKRIENYPEPMSYWEPKTRKDKRKSKKKQ